MVIVWGCVEAKGDCVEALLGISLEHVRRSRGEPGCIRHEVMRDVENDRRLVFFEEWRDMAALQVHFGVAESKEFVEAAAGLSVAAPEIRIFESEQVG